MSGNTHRQGLEKAILGAMLLENCYGRVGGILKTINFEYNPHKTVYETISNLWPNRPIDMLTVTLELLKKGQLQSVGGAYYVTELTRGVNSSANLEYWAICLLEMDIKQKVATLIRRNEIDLLNNQQYDLAGLCKQVLKEIMLPINPIFETINMAIRFFHSYGLPDLSEELISLLDGVDERAAQIKKYSQFNTLVKNLKDIINQESIPLTLENKRTTKALLNLAYQSAIGGTIPNSIQSTLNQEAI